MRVAGTHHVALVTADFPRLRDFYAETLGFPQVGAFAGREIVFLQAGDTTIELIARDAADRPADDGAGWTHLAFDVEDTDAAHAELTALGVPFHVAPKDFPEDAPAVRIAFFRDPDGNALERVQPLGPRYPTGN